MRVIFDGDEATFTLFEAAIWIGGKGWNLSDEQTHAVFEDGVAVLFKILASGRVTANGIRRETQIREDIPAAYWERAAEYPPPSTKKHSVSFIDDTCSDKDGSGFGGTLTPYGDDAPRWTDIGIDGPILRAIYPFGSHKSRLTSEELHARDEIIGRASRGEITPSEADAQALRRIGEPIATRPEPSSFRPEREPWWTLTMALAWIVRRDLDFVRCYSNDYRRNWWVWRPSTVGLGTPSQRPGWIVETKGQISLPESLLDLTLDTSNRADGKPVVDLGQAEVDLLHKLRGGQLTAYAVSIADRSPIPDYEWINVNIGDACRQFSGEPWVRSDAVMTQWEVTGKDGKEKRLPRRPRVQRDATLMALKELYPDSDGDPGAERRKDVLRRVNAFLRKSGGYPVERDTLRRAIEEIRSA